MDFSGILAEFMEDLDELRCSRGTKAPLGGGV